MSQRSFTEEIWQRVPHPDEDRLLGGLFALSAPFLAAPSGKARAGWAGGTASTSPSIGVRPCRSRPAGRGAGIADARVVPGENEAAQTAILNLQYKGRLKAALALAPSTQRRTASTWCSTRRPDEVLGPSGSCALPRYAGRNRHWIARRARARAVPLAGNRGTPR
jgi:hypothetical protein